MSLEGLTVHTISSSARVVSRAVCEICCACAADLLRADHCHLRQFPKQGHLGQIRAELIMQVTRDPRALFFERLLLPHAGNWRWSFWVET